VDEEPMDVFDNTKSFPMWIQDGLLQLQHLKWLEVELEVVDWDDDKKIRWCAALEEMLNSHRDMASGHRVSVNPVERDVSPPRKMI